MTEKTTTQFTISKDLVLVNQKVETKEEIIRKLGGMLYEQGFVKDTYTQAVVDREVVYPTGLQARAAGVAVPHTDTEHVIKPAVAIATLQEPLIFQGMGMPDTKIPVTIIMMLAIHDPKLVVHILRKVIMIIENDEALTNILAADNGAQIEKIMQEHIEKVSK